MIVLPPLARLLFWIVLLAIVFAHLEIQIEGAAGWAENLPTWRRQVPRTIRFLWGGRPCTGYHVYLFLFMAMAFHLPQFIGVRHPLRAEAQILGSLMLFWVLEDFFWFVFNPAYGLKTFRRGRIPWHPYWWCGVPVDYLAYGGLSTVLFAVSVFLGSGTEGSL